MNILTTNQIREADAYTIRHEPISSVALMERAAKACHEWIYSHFSNDTVFITICGTGNNGGDGLAIADGLQNENRGVIKVIPLIVPFFTKFSEDFLAVREKYPYGKRRIREIQNAEEIRTEFLKHKKVVIIDALLGSGLTRPVDGELAEVIQVINSLNSTVVSIDMPSGLAMEDNTGFDRKNIVRATYTLTFETPKLSFMFAENAESVGEFHVLDIGLDKNFIAEQKTKDHWLTEEMVREIIKPRAKFSHKGDYGHALLIAGSYGKIGAAVLGARACLRTGAGLVTTHIPKCGMEIMQTSVPEAMVMADEEMNEVSVIKDLSKFNAIGIGPGIGTSENTAKGLKKLIQDSSVNMVLDADALNILSENKTWLSFLKPGTILTPHPGEFARLAGKSTTGFEAYTKQREFAMKYRIYIVLKGACTSIACPDGKVYFNSTGNPGMATGGSGDTLTGIILGLLAQQYAPQHAALLGVYIHGLAGDIAAMELGENSLIAEDITNCLGQAFLTVMSDRL